MSMQETQDLITKMVVQNENIAPDISTVELVKEFSVDLVANVSFIDILVESCYVASNSTNLVFDSFKTKAEYKRLLKAHSELIFNTQNWSSDIDSFNQTQGFRYMILTYINEVLEEE